MACRWIDSMTAYASAADIQSSYSVTGAAISFTSSGGRWSNGMISFTNTNTNMTKSFSPGLSSWAVGFAFKINSANGTAFFRMREGSTEHTTLQYNTTSGRLTLTNVGTALRPFVFSVWHTVAIVYTCADSPAGSASWWIDDEFQGSVSGADTRNGGTAGLIDNFLFTQHGGGQTDFGEFYVNDLTGSAPNNDKWLGWRIDARIPNAAGNYAEFTPLSSTNVSNVDERVHDSDATYNSSSTANQRDSFQYSAAPSSVGTVPAIMPRIVARRDDAGPRTMRRLQRQSSTDYTGTTVTLTGSYSHYAEVVETNPATGVAYTLSEMKATSPEFGYELVS